MNWAHESPIRYCNYLTFRVSFTRQETGIDLWVTLEEEKAGQGDNLLTASWRICCLLALWMEETFRSRKVCVFFLQPTRYRTTLGEGEEAEVSLNICRYRI